MASDTTPGDQQAPRYTVPNKKFITVEHPFVVKNVDKAIDMLGGRGDMAEALHSSKPLNLSFSPGDPTTRSLASLSGTTDNVLLRITVPKRIGKRKRDSDEPFFPLQASNPVMRDAHHLLRSMHDNKEQITVEAIGSIRQSHVWRSMPDFNYSTRGLDSLSDLKSNILSQDYALLQQWSLPKTYGLQNTEVAPPPVFSSHSLPQPYLYHQSILHKNTEDEAPDQEPKPRSDRRERSFAMRCSSAGPFPIAPPASAPELDSMFPAVQKAVPILRDLFAQRPIWTRRALANHLEEVDITPSHKTALAYVAFSISSGVWSRTLCAFGVNPLSDPRYRKFQTVATIKDRKRDGNAGQSAQSAAPATDRRSHIFTGQGPLSEDGSIYQMCDLEDPQLKALVDVEETHLSREADPEAFGWYGNGTMSKIRIVLRAKTSAMRNGEPVLETHFKRILALPERCDFGATTNEKDTNGLGYLPDSPSVREKAMAKAYREGLRNSGRFKMRNSDNVQRFESDDDDYDQDDEGIETDLAGHETREDIVEGVDGSVMDGQDSAMQEDSTEEHSHSPQA